MAVQIVAESRSLWPLFGRISPVFNGIGPMDLYCGGRTGVRAPASPWNKDRRVVGACGFSCFERASTA